MCLQAFKEACDPKYESDLDCLKKAVETDVKTNECNMAQDYTCTHPKQDEM